MAEIPGGSSSADPAPSPPKVSSARRSRTERSSEPSTAAQPSRRAGATRPVQPTSADPSGPGEPPDEDDPFYDEDPGENGATPAGHQHDPETQALDLLKNGLGARLVD